jgi:hypothetical protein
MLIGACFCLLLLLILLYFCTYYTEIFKFPCFLGLRLRGGKDFDDAASDVSLSSTTSGYRSGRGQAYNSLRNPVIRIRICRC